MMKSMAEKKLRKIGDEDDEEESDPPVPRQQRKKKLMKRRSRATKSCQVRLSIPYWNLR